MSGTISSIIKPFCLKDCKLMTFEDFMNFWWCENDLLVRVEEIHQMIFIPLKKIN